MTTDTSNAELVKPPINSVVLLSSNLIKFLFSKWLIILLLSIIGLCLGIWYASTTKPVYKSRLTFALEDGGSGGGLSGAMGLAAQLGLSIGGGGDVFSGDNIIEILKSRRNFNEVMLSADTLDGVASTLINRYLSISN